MRPFIHFAVAVLLATFSQLSIAAESITIKAISGLQYDVKQFAVEPGAKVSISFINDDATDMPHNLVFTKPGKRMDVVNAAMAMGAAAIDAGYVPKSDDVIAAIPEVKPHAKAKLSFTAPAEKGIYHYVCTYPGHGLLMFGNLYVGVPMPAEKPVVEAAEASPHAYPLVRPYLYRLFMPNSNPASVALMLPGDINLCWDAHLCCPRYIWRGAGVDISKYWKGNGSGRVQLVGDTVWTAEEKNPLRFSKEKPAEVQFKGYTLHQGFPEFNYLVDGVLVKALIRDQAKGEGITISFQVDSDNALYYVAGSKQNDLFSSSVGKFTNGILSVPAKSGRSFTVTIKPVAKEVQ